jgi:branched-chain amino acid transport system substrate-binding protein
MEKADVKPSMSVSDICSALKTAIVEIEFTGLTTAGKTMTWEANGEPNKAPMAVVIKDGVYTSMQ